MDKHDYWLKVDNAGKVFPAVSNYSRSSTFRVAFYLNEDVIPEVLQKALDLTLPRFETFAVKIKSGLFWNYFASNNNPCPIEEETSHIGRYAMKNPTQYCFKILYYKRRISLETFHALSDGYGATQFLKSIVYEYLKLLGKEINHEHMILLEKPMNKFESIDSFVDSSNTEQKKADKDTKAFVLKGDIYPNNWSSFVKLSINLADFKALVKTKGCSVTMLAASLLIYSIYKSQPGAKNSKKPIIIFIPVNLRKYFNSDTLRNFSLFIKVIIYPRKKNWDLDSILEEIKIQFNEQLNKDFLQKRINYYVAFEKNPFIRIVPLFIKNIIFKVVYALQSNNLSTSYISNLGSLELPKDMKNEIRDMDFVNTGERYYMTMASVENKLNIMFSSRIRDYSSTFQFINELKSFGFDIVVQTNHTEK